MNFLAHIYLSGEDESIIIGNFIADGIKGKNYQKYPPKIAKGILLHRAIDSYTDSHPTVHQSTARLHKNYSHYSGVIVDILYDHFLAKNWHKYSDQPLAEYIEDFYNLLKNNFTILPTRIQKMMPHMIADNWLLSYASVAGIGTILAQMNIRTKGVSKMNLAVAELEAYYDEFEAEFTSFFDELIQHSQQKLLEL
ncbi:acyl carrier protein phosphodiesterase [Aequorivita sp. Q41]|uniref:acyl carrier protein phosphodiesterase n=1 Tax=Aequorivita sp. Q41 TaxID=3153300 RepID=UPI003242A617